MAALSSSPPSPWPASQLTEARRNGSTHGWKIRDGMTSYIEIDAFGVSYELDESRSPFGTAKFRVPIGSLTWFDPIHLLGPRYLVAGYSGYQGLIFSGFTSRSTRVVNAGQNYAEVELTTGEDLWDGPLGADYAVPDSYSTLKSVVDDFTDGTQGDICGRNWPMLSWVAPLDTPTSGQLAAFRALDFSAGDSSGDMLRTCASALGQKIQGDHLGGWRGGSSPIDSLPVVKIAPQYVFAAGSALTINPSEWTTYERVSAADDFAASIRLTAQWISSGDLKSSTYVYKSAAEWNLGDRTTTKDVTIQLRPELSGGVRKLTSTNPIGKAYQAAAYRRTWQVTITMRAWWWLEPGASLTVVGPEGQTDNGVVSRVVVDVDAGLMTVTIRPS